MTDKTQETVAATEQAAPAENATANEVASFKELTDIDGNYSVAEIGAVLAAIPSLEGYDEKTPIVTNFTADDMPDAEERVMVVKTSSRRGEEGVSLISVWAIPTLSAIAKLSQTYVADLIYSQLARKLTNNALRSEKPLAENYPRSVSDFISARRGGGTSKKAFNAICKHILGALKNAGIKMSKADLVDAMSSTSFATDRYAQLEEKGIFVKFLNSAVTLATNKGDDATQFQTYIETRDETDLETVDDVDFDAIAFDLG